MQLLAVSLDCISSSFSTIVSSLLHFQPNAVVRGLRCILASVKEGMSVPPSVTQELSFLEMRFSG